jgi:hypothetical protein
MARSQLLKDIVSGKENIENILLRIKVILSDLDNELIMNWVNGELQGYKNIEDVPSYRILKGRPEGTYIVNNQIKYTNASVPLEGLLSKETIDELNTLKVRDSIMAIKNILDGDNRNNYSKPVDTYFCHSISIAELQIASMKISFSSNQLDGILSNVKSKLVEIVMELEKQFEHLDELDIKPQVEENLSKKEKAVYNIGQIIYDGSITVGDKNKISGSKLGHFFSRR